MFVYTCIYETKGLSLEQVDELYAKVPRAWNSVGWVPAVNYTEQLEFDAGEKKAEAATHLESVGPKTEA